MCQRCVVNHEGNKQELLTEMPMPMLDDESSPMRCGKRQGESSCLAARHLLTAKCGLEVGLAVLVVKDEDYDYQLRSIIYDLHSQVNVMFLLRRLLLLLDRYQCTDNAQYNANRLLLDLKRL